MSIIRFFACNWNLFCSLVSKPMKMDCKFSWYLFQYGQKLIKMRKYKHIFQVHWIESVWYPLLFGKKEKHVKKQTAQKMKIKFCSPQSIWPSSNVYSIREKLYSMIVHAWKTCAIFIKHIQSQFINASQRFLCCWINI